MEKIDLRGLFVPETMFKLDIAIDKIEDREELLALIDDLESEDWIVRWAHKNNHDVTSIEKVATGLNVIINKGGYVIDT